MSRDFLASTLGREFLKSPNRDRITHVPKPICPDDKIQLIAQVSINFPSISPATVLSCTEPQIIDFAAKANAALDSIELETGFNLRYEGIYPYPALPDPLPPEPPWLNERLGVALIINLISRSAIPSVCADAFGVERSISDQIQPAVLTRSFLSKSRIFSARPLCFIEQEFTNYTNPPPPVSNYRFEQAGTYDMDADAIHPRKLHYSPVFPSQWHPDNISGNQRITVRQYSTPANCGGAAL